MSYGNAYQNYKEQSVNTMTKGEMLNLLYEEMIKRLKRAKIGAEKEDYALFDSEIKRTKEIVTYLVNSLNRKYSVSKDLLRLYDFINYELARISASRNINIIDEVLPFIVELRDTFKEADRIAKKTGGMTALGG
ncbi:flagellar export chaperone FliS [Anaerovorax odorimutans]|uniref:flagellar export chaperone FliS n=1 Tax=Anaerovorax odorimutans TaxID=109327 RepID=UPI00042722EB|nr:flagellar export chaperone FliS [Anaerovorax odorimutans]